jgi:hypothetical protein
MTKDWAQVKDKVRKLYVEEGRPLERVRILMAEDGFDASWVV